MRIFASPLKQVKDICFLHLEISDSDIKFPISAEGFVDKAKNVLELTYLDVGENEHGKGLGRRALTELRQIYDRIDVFAIQPQAVGFWSKMFAEKIISSMHYDVHYLSNPKQKIWNSI